MSVMKATPYCECCGAKMFRVDDIWQCPHGTLSDCKKHAMAKGLVEKEEADREILDQMAQLLKQIEYYESEYWSSPGISTRRTIKAVWRPKVIECLEDLTEWSAAVTEMWKNER